MPTLSLVTYILAGVIVLLIVWVIRLEMRLRKYWRGKNGADLESHINEIGKSIDTLHLKQKDFSAHAQYLENKSRASIRNVEMLRFNPFKDQGSNQSFAIAMLNDEGDGVVLSTLYSRERMSLFAKPIKNRSSEFELSVEEKEVLARASKEK